MESIFSCWSKQNEWDKTYKRIYSRIYCGYFCAGRKCLYFVENESSACPASYMRRREECRCVIWDERFLLIWNTRGIAKNRYDKKRIMESKSFACYVHVKCTVIALVQIQNHIFCCLLLRFTRSYDGIWDAAFHFIAYIELYWRTHIIACMCLHMHSAEAGRQTGSEKNRWKLCDLQIRRATALFERGARPYKTGHIWLDMCGGAFTRRRALFFCCCCIFDWLIDCLWNVWMLFLLCPSRPIATKCPIV